MQVESEVLVSAWLGGAVNRLESAVADCGCTAPPTGARQDQLRTTGSCLNASLHQAPPCIVLDSLSLGSHETRGTPSAVLSFSTLYNTELV